MSKNEALEAKRAYYRAWRKNNRDKVKVYDERYWTKKAEQQKEAGASGKDK